jgi:hypothetical protein
MTIKSTFTEKETQINKSGYGNGIMASGSTI